MNSQLILHIGYPKTGTTTLQKHVFNMSMFGNIYLNHKQIDKITFQNEIAFKNSVNELSDYIDVIKQNGQKKSKKIFIISSETLTSVSTFFRFTPHPFIWCPDPSSIARKLKYLIDKIRDFDKIKIVVVIRKQTDFLKSNYAQMYNLVYKRFRQTNTFEKYIEYSYNKNYDNFIGSAINYNKVILEYEDLFGKENIKVLVYEELLKEPQKYAEKWSNILDCNANLILERLKIIENVKSFGKRYKLQKINLVQYLANNPKFNWLKFIGNKKTQSNFKNNLRKIEFGEGNIKLNILDEGKIMNYYFNDNKELSERHNLGLKRYNYY